MVAWVRILAVVAALMGGTSCSAFDYSVAEVGDISLVDVETGIEDIKTIFTNEEIAVSVSGLTWEAASTDSSTSSSSMLLCQTFLGDVVVAEVAQNLTGVNGNELPDSIDCGTVTMTRRGRHQIGVKVTMDDSEASTSAEFATFAPGVSLIPLIVVLVLAVTTKLVEFSLFVAIFVGACMVTGNLNDGFKALLETYILEALADPGHAYVFLFTFFLSGIVALMEKSGGMSGFTNAVGKYAKTSRSGQLVTFMVGILVFFDDYANTLLAGETMRPLTDLLFVSREKLAFIVDATAAPIASLAPISSWVGFEIGLIEAEIERIAEIYGEENLTIKTSGMAVFLQSIKYRYYPIFMIILVPLLIITQRDFGPMLIAERKTQVYKITNGGEGAMGGNKYGIGLEPEDSPTKDENKPRRDTPLRAWNMLFPLVLLVFFIFYLLVKSGDDGSGEQSFLEKIEGSDSYAALLWGTMATALLTMFFYMLQFVQDGQLVFPTPSAFRGLFRSDTGDGNFSSQPRLLVPFKDSLEAFLYGMGRIFPALIVLTLAWASGAIMTDVGADRLFSRWIVAGVSAESLPTFSFIISAFMALATGTSWGTMTILFPLICLPTYEVSNGDPTIFYATVAGILSGSVAGDHASPISDTTVLSALASDCDLIAHVSTQAPYTLAVSTVAILLGTIPVGRDAWPNFVGIIVGAVVIFGFVFGVCVPILSPTGRFDVITMLIMKCRGEGSPLHKLQDDTIRTVGGQDDEGGVESAQDVPETKELETKDVETKELETKDVETNEGETIEGATKGETTALVKEVSEEEEDEGEEMVA